MAPESTNRKPQWPPIDHETLPWHRDADALALVPKSRRRRITSTYEAALPIRIADRTVDMPHDLRAHLDELLITLSHFDATLATRDYSLPALLLRSESAASSQIENLTSSARNVAMAELSEQVPHNAKLIAANLAAVKAALGQRGAMSVDTILTIQRTLSNLDDSVPSDGLRNEQVWIGGTSFSPHDALFVPPVAQHVPAHLEDLVSYINETPEHPLVKIAVAHAQFETIHPFIDGNGRTGRVLIHWMLRDSGVLAQGNLPVSAGLLHDIDPYMTALRNYQMGDPVAIVEQLAGALDTSLFIGSLFMKRVDSILAGWIERMTERRGSKIRELPRLLVEQPVVTIPYVAEQLEITSRAASNLVARACDYGILRAFGNKRRGRFFQSDELVDVLEEISSVEGIRRVLATGRL